MSFLAEYTSRCLDALISFFQIADVTLAQQSAHVERHTVLIQESTTEDASRSTSSHSDQLGKDTSFFTFVTTPTDQSDDDHNLSGAHYTEELSCSSARFDHFELDIMDDLSFAHLHTNLEAPFYYFRAANGTNHVTLQCYTDRILGHGLMSRVYAGQLFCSTIPHTRRSPSESTSSRNSSYVCTGRSTVDRQDDDHLSDMTAKTMHQDDLGKSGQVILHCVVPVAVKVWYEPRNRWRDAVDFAQFWRTQFRALGSQDGLTFGYGIHVSAARPRPDAKVCVQKRYLCCCMTSELGRGGAVDQLVKQRERLDEVDIRAILFDVVRTLDWMHRVARRCHNDVKPHNIVDTAAEMDQMSNVISRNKNIDKVNDAGNHNSVAIENDLHRVSVRYKLIDWSASTVTVSPLQVHDTLLQMWQSHTELENRAASGGTHHELQTGMGEDHERMTGTVAFMSPERCLGLSGSAAGDVWSLGVSVFYLATGRVPWTAMEAGVPELILHHVRSRFSRGCLFPFQQNTHSSTDADTLPDAAMKTTLSTQTSRHMNKDSALAETVEGEVDHGILLDELESSSYSPELRSFVHACLADDPLERPTCEGLLRHPFLKQTS